MNLNIFAALNHAAVVSLLVGYFFRSLGERCPQADATLRLFHQEVLSFYAEARTGDLGLQGLVVVAKRILALDESQTLDCPPAVAQAALLRMGFILYTVHSGEHSSSQQFVYSSFEEVHDLERRYGNAFQHVWIEELEKWPLEHARAYVLEYSRNFEHQVSEGTNLWRDVMEGGETISDNEYHAVLQVAGKVLDALGVEWWPCRGTLITLLRHGARTGVLSEGHIDSFDEDVDLMVGVDSEGHWNALIPLITEALQAEGWPGDDGCYAKRSAREAWARTDLLYCRRKPGGPIVLDITSYIKGAANLDVFIHRRCRGDGGDSGNMNFCEVPRDIGPMAASGGRLRKSAIYPLGRCRADSFSVPCPHRPLDTLKSMKSYNFTRTCLPLPTPSGRNDDDLNSAWLIHEGLNAEDIHLLYKRAEELHNSGFKSMKPYFWSCRRLRQVY